MASCQSANLMLMLLEANKCMGLGLLMVIHED